LNQWYHEDSRPSGIGRAERDIVPSHVSKRSSARPVRANELVLLLDEVLGTRSRFAWYETLGNLTLLTRVPPSLAAEWAELRALDRARSLCTALEGCRLPLRDAPGTRYYAALADPAPTTYGDLARMLREVIDSLTAARETRTPPAAVRAKPRKRRPASTAKKPS
jgi:hypothetical protein